MHYSIIIISENKINIDGCYNINNKITFVDDCHLLSNDVEISFDYLIYTSINLVECQKEIGILTESKIPVTNFEKQTSVENIYYSKEEDILDIIENL